ncbi:hypothetical protein [Sphingobacterium litopenaei]|uniref:Uncharacterized protein n=1 Tax=Sphingobacterium litopenaei TaxID=2763500 RepID=A0ABR7YGU6_9SPHI|nr:hypothetical protein [Sphingobacterium litopenaei]MBD1430522.1 hypothetical protein [Sphingobacterium litopenaei]
MKTLSVVCIILLLLAMGCGQSNSDSKNVEENSPGPVTEPDRQRYNLNPNDEVVYGSVDSLNQDSIRRDSLK